MSKIRLVCPSCAARYDVPAEVIPAAGRDVQCSSCGHTWFQVHPDTARPRAAPPPSPTPEADPDTAEPARAAGVAPPAPPAPPVAAEPEPMPEAPPRRALDPEVAEVLRQERAFEDRRRAQAAGTLETQPDLGLEAPANARGTRDRRMAAGAETVEDGIGPRAAPNAPAAESGTGRSRRGLLPDVDEVSQTLRRDRADAPAIDPQAGEDWSDAPEPRSGFARGFAIVLIAAMLAIAAYGYSDALKLQMPGVAGGIDAYVALVNDLRLWFDGQVAGFLALLDDLGAAEG